MQWTSKDLRRTRYLRSLSTTLAFAVCCLPTTAIAQDGQTSDRANAVEFFDKAAALEKAGLYAEACPKYAESYRLDPKLGALLHLADCYEHNGQIASAYAAFREASELATKLQDKRLTVANERAQALRSKVPHLVVRVESNIEGLEISKDGTPLSRAEWGTELALDPGQHTIDAKAPGKQPWTAAVQVPTNGETMIVAVPDLASAEALPGVMPSSKPAMPLYPPDRPAATIASAAPMASAASVPPVAPAVSSVNGNAAGSTVSPGHKSDAFDRGQPSSATVQKTMAFVAGGLGLVGLVVGTVFGLQVMSDNRKSNSLCTPKSCTANERTSYNASVQRAENARTTSLVSFSVGGAALATGAILLFTTPKAKPNAVSLLPTFDVGQAGATLQGVW